MCLPRRCRAYYRPLKIHNDDDWHIVLLFSEYDTVGYDMSSKSDSWPVQSSGREHSRCFLFHYGRRAESRSRRDVQKITINDTIYVFLGATGNWYISNYNSFRVLFDEIASVYFISKIYLWKWPVQGTSTVPIVSAHCWSLCTCIKAENQFAVVQPVERVVQLAVWTQNFGHPPVRCWKPAFCDLLARTEDWFQYKLYKV